MKIIQLLPTLSFGDAVSNDVLAIKTVISEMGFETAVYADIIDKRLPVGSALYTEKLKELNHDDIIIYHMSTGSDLWRRLNKFNCRKIMIYHNITPPVFFRPYNSEAAALTEYGYDNLRKMKNTFSFCFADSEYNKGQLIKSGYTCPVEVRPVLIQFDDYKKSPDEKIMKKYSDGKKNILFVGRIAPNKRQEDIIKAFFCFRKLNPASRLILVGSCAGFENYNKRLIDYAEALEISKDIIFSGHVRFSEILAFYRTADIFLCMSRHEGFCVPLLEAMNFDVPIVAYGSSAIPETLGGSGFLLDSSEPWISALAADRIIHDSELKNQIISGQRKRLEYFSYEKTKTLFKSQLKKFIESKYL